MCDVKDDQAKINPIENYYLETVEFGEIQKFSRLAERAGELNTKYTVNSIFVQNSTQLYTFM